VSNVFPQSESLYRDAVRAVSNPGDYFASPEYETLKRQAAEAFSKLEPGLQPFFDVIRGLGDGAPLGHPGIGAALSFPSRFLRTPSVATLPRPLGDLLDTIVKQAFFLGLATHFSLHTFLTRSAIDKVQVASLLKEWFPFSLMASELLSEYSKEANDLPRRIFEWYFDVHAKPALGGSFGLGFWRLGKARSFFRNLYFAGARLGIQFDLSTRGVA